MSAREPQTGRSHKKKLPPSVIADAVKPANGSNGSGLHEDPPLDLEELLTALQSMRDGSFSVRMAGDRVGLAGKIADTFNEIVANNQRMAEQLERVGEMVGRQGKTRHRVKLGRSTGSWGEMESS